MVLTSYHEDEHIFPALKAGAISYILKDMKMEKLADAIQRADRKAKSPCTRWWRRGCCATCAARAMMKAFYADLTERELDVLKLIAKGLSNSQIADELVISENTVKGHVSNILSKLHLADRTQVAVYAWQKGIVRRNA